MGNKVRVLVATGTMNAGGAETLIMEQLGQKSENVEYYLTSLIMPALLSINFIIMPFFYKLLLNSKRFY